MNPAKLQRLVITSVQESQPAPEQRRVHGSVSFRQAIPSALTQGAVYSLQCVAQESYWYCSSGNALDSIKNSALRLTNAHSTSWGCHFQRIFNCPGCELREPGCLVSGNGILLLVIWPFEIGFDIMGAMTSRAQRFLASCATLELKWRSLRSACCDLRRSFLFSADYAQNHSESVESTSFLLGSEIGPRIGQGFDIFILARIGSADVKAMHPSCCQVCGPACLGGLKVYSLFLTPPTRA